MSPTDVSRWISRSRALDLGDFPWDEVGRHPLPSEAVRTLRYMQDIESHTIVYLRTLLATRAIDEPAIATFLACWLYEETFHGLALARFLEAAGHTVRPRARGALTLGQRLRAALTARVASAWPDFVAVHMTWGAINELTTLCGYRRLAAIAGHPVLADLLGRIARDESRHFQFYFDQAAARLVRPGVARIARLLVEGSWAPVGSGEQPAAETRFLAAYLFAGSAGAGAVRRVDATIGRLPGFEDARLLERWLRREVPTAAPAGTGEPALSASVRSASRS